MYRDVFLQTPRRNTQCLAADEAREVLERSGLSSMELHQIWQLSNVATEGELTLPEFVCAMHLAARRRQGFAIPDELPLELAAMVQHQSVDAASDFNGGLARSDRVASDLSNADGSWAMSPDELQNYRALFVGLRSRVDDKAGIDDVRDLFESSGLPQEDLAHIWQLSDVDMDNLLTFGEFACAVHLLARRRTGAQLPPALPAELARLVMEGCLVE